MISFKNIGHLGRFGNQMFQFAATVGIARSLGYDPVFPLENFIKNGDPDSYTGCKLMDCFEIPDSMIMSISDINIIYLYHESEFTYDPRIKNIPQNTDISGYFQTSKYFDNVASEIKEIFTFKKSIIEKSKKYHIEDNGVSVHVRRGDYLSYPLHHPTQSIEYYKLAMNEFPEDSNFYIFSDDIDWCIENLGSPNLKLNFIDSKNPYIDLYLMTQCEGHIIANSSLSWWGSWLSTKSKKTIAPSNWFGPQINKDTRDIYCKNWKII